MIKSMGNNSNLLQFVGQIADVQINVLEYDHDTNCYFSEVRYSFEGRCTMPLGYMQVRLCEDKIFAQQVIRCDYDGSDSKNDNCVYIVDAISFILSGREDVGIVTENFSIAWLMPNLEKYDNLDLPDIVSSSLRVYINKFEELKNALVSAGCLVLVPTLAYAVYGEQTR